MYRNFQEYKAFKTSFQNEGIFGGKLLAIKSKDFINFYDWEEFNVIRQIEVSSNIKNVYWSDDGNTVVLAMDSTFYLLSYNNGIVQEILETGALE